MFCGGILCYCLRYVTHGLPRRLRERIENGKSDEISNSLKEVRDSLHCANFVCLQMHVSPKYDNRSMSAMNLTRATSGDVFDSDGKPGRLHADQREEKAEDLRRRPRHVLLVAQSAKSFDGKRMLHMRNM